MMYRILLADDHGMVRQGLRALLEKAGHTIVGEAEDGRVAVDRARELGPDIAILDISMPNLNGIDAAREIAQISPRTQVIVLTMYADKVYVLQALQAGVRGYVLKIQVAEDLIRAVREVGMGALYLSPGVSTSVAEGYLDKVGTPSNPLSARQRQVLQLISEGLTSKEMAQALHISFKTVETHRCHIMKKLDIHDIAGLVRYAINRGMLRP